MKLRDRLLTAWRILRNATYLENDGWFADWLRGGAKTGAGVSISERTALTISDVYKCQRVLAETVAMLPMKIYARIPGGQEEAPDHSIYSLVHDEPNENMTAFTFKEGSMGHLLSWGNSYSYVERYGYSGRVAALWPLCPDRVRIETNNYDAPIYRVRAQSGQETVFDYRDVLHIPGFGYDGIQGYSPIRLMREALGWAKGTELYGARFIGNDSTPSGFLATPVGLSADAAKRLKASWKEKQGGENQHDIAVLEEGMTFQRMSINPDDAQFLETRKFQRTDIAGMYRVPPHKIGDLERATFSNIEQQDLEFLRDSIMPWLKRIEQEYNRKLFSPQEKKKFFIEFEVTALMRGDTATQTEHIREMMNLPIYSANEARRYLGLNPYEGGDRRFIQLNMIPIDKLDDFYNKPAQPALNPPESQPNPPQNVREHAEKLVKNVVKKAYHSAFRDAIGRLINKKPGERPRYASSMEWLLIGIAAGLGFEEPADSQFIPNYIRALGERARGWTFDDKANIVNTELEAAITAMLDRSRQHVARDVSDE